MYFLKKVISLTVIILLLISLQNCATFVGYRIGKKLDSQHESRNQTETFMVSDSTAADSLSSNKLQEKEKTHYVLIGIGVGLVVDAAIFVLLVRASMSSFNPNIRL